MTPSTLNQASTLAGSALTAGMGAGISPSTLNQAPTLADLATTAGLGASV